jgi:hypothetical protein
MNRLAGDRLYVRLSASQLRRRLKGQGLGVRKIESAGRGRAAIVHTATGDHLRQLKALLEDVLEQDENLDATPAPDAGSASDVS